MMPTGMLPNPPGQKRSSEKERLENSTEAEESPRGNWVRGWPPVSQPVKPGII